MKSIKHNYLVGQEVSFGNKKVTVAEQREFHGRPSYLVEWVDKNDKLWKAVLKEDEIS